MRMYAVNLKSYFKRKTKNYFQNSSVHGLRFISDPDSHFLERLFWVAVCSLSCVGMYFLFDATLENYRNNPISFVSETSYINWNTTFPAVVACELVDHETNQLNVQHLVGNTSFIYRDRYFIPFTYELMGFKTCSLCQKCDVYEGMCDIESIYSLVSRYYAPCNEVLVNCSWNGEPFDCCSHFRPLKTMDGTCFAYNTIQNQVSSKKPKLLSVNKISGPGKLQFSPLKPLIFHLLGSDEVPYAGNPGVWQKSTILFGVDALIKFKVIEMVNDPMLREIPVEQRKCRFTNENPFHVYPFYSYSTCVIDCLTKRQMELCGCVHHYMPDMELGKNPLSCNNSGRACVSNEWLKFQRVASPNVLNDPDAMPCSCLPSCTEMELIQVYSKTVRRKPAGPALVNVEMEGLPTTRFIRNVVRTKLDLVVSLGGAAGLFLGASLLSVVEIIYYFCIRGEKQKKEMRQEPAQKNKIMFDLLCKNKSSIILQPFAKDLLSQGLPP